MKDGNHQQILNLLHRTKQRSESLDLISNIQQIVNKLLGIIENPKPKKVASSPIVQEFVKVSKKSEVLFSSRDIHKESIKIIPHEEIKTVVSEKRNSWKVAKSYMNAIPKFTLLKSKGKQTDNGGDSESIAESRKKSKKDSADDIVTIPKALSDAESLDQVGPSQELRKNHRKSLRKCVRSVVNAQSVVTRRESTIKQEYKNDLPKNYSKYVDEMLDGLAEVDLNEKVSAFNSLNADLRTQIYDGEAYYRLTGGLLLYLQNESGIS
jgi:hypothetical protein